MNPQKTTITILATLSVSIALADDFKTINGKEYKNVTVSRVEADGIVIKGKSGILKVYFVELPKDVQERFAVQQGEKINHEVSLKDYPGVRGGPPEKVLELVFDRDVPQPQAVDKMLRESLEHAVAADGSRDILAMAFQGDEVLSDTQYSGELMYRAAERKIMTIEEARGVKTTITDAAGYSVKVSEEKTNPGIKPERKWLTISLIYPTPPPLEEAYRSMQSEIEKNVPRGMDINAFVKIGDKGVKTSQRQMDDPSGGYVFMTYDAASNKLSRKNATASPAATLHQAPMNVAKPAEQAQSTVQQAIEKLQRENLLRLDCTDPDAKAWIAPMVWISCDAQQKENFTKGLAAYYHPEYPSIWILDKQSGRKLASYGPFRGFEAY